MYNVDAVNPANGDVPKVGLFTGKVKKLVLVKLGLDVEYVNERFAAPPVSLNSIYNRYGPLAGSNDIRANE
jgi:hypothetical protein